MKENGANFDNIEYPVAFHINGSLVGIGAAKDIPAGSVLIDLPEKLSVNRKTVMNSEIGPLMKAHPDIFNKHAEVD